MDDVSPAMAARAADMKSGLHEVRKIPWSRSLSLRLLALGLMPLLVALPFVLGVLWFTLSWVSDNQFALTIRGNLAGAENYLDQLKESAHQQITDYSMSEQLVSMLQRTPDDQEWAKFLGTGARERGLDFLIVATPDGRVIGSSSGIPPGTRLPDSFALRQASLGMTNAAFEIFAGDELPRFSKAFAGGSPPPPAGGARGLLVDAATHLPLAVNAPEAILIGGILLNGNTSLVERIRDIVFPIAPQENEEGMVTICADDVVVARSRSKGEGVPEPGGIHGPDIVAAVLGGSATWIGSTQINGTSVRAGVSPILNGEGKAIGMLGVAMPDAGYRNRMLTLVGVVAGLMALTMLAISVIFTSAGKELAQRIQTLNGTMNMVRSGMKGARTSGTTLDDEIGQLARDFDDLLDTIRTQQEELDRLANYDSLTGIPNRRLLGDRLEQAIAGARRRGTALAVCMMDLDGFKPVNDSHGHETGDLLLVEIARRLTHVMRAGETVARVGGDEFVLVFDNPESPAVFERILQAVREPATIKGNPVQVSASMGIAYLSDKSAEGDQLLREADQALYRSKQNGRNRFTILG